ncbi:MAG: alpha/beta hydrolase [Candidatus Limivicinus sp.]|jgi:pimeloyl-ACP methyl ester carboxylesterase
MDKSIRNKALKTAAAAALAGTAVFCLGTGLSVEYSMAGEASGLLKLAKLIFPGSRHKNPLIEEKERLESDLSSRPSEEIRIKSRDGLSLTGHWIGCDKPKRIIIAMHGWHSGWSRDFGFFQDFWKDNSCSILYPEQRAQGSSEGKYSSFGLMERWDCMSWLDWVVRNKGTEVPIYLMGISMGAATVLMASELGLPDCVHGIIADCGYTSPLAIMKYTAKRKFGSPYILEAPIADRVFRKNISVSIREASPIEAMKKAGVPVLFIHGEDDRLVPVGMSFENYAACTSPKRILTVPGAVHGVSYIADKDAYERAVKSFWNEFD